MNGPRIALSGSAGTGKTTLGQLLSERLERPFVEEGIRRRIADGLVPAALSVTEYEDLIEELWAEQSNQEQALTGGFVADRSACDYAAFWIHYGGLHDRERTESVLARWFERTRDYDAVVLLPWGALELEDDGVRSTNRWLQFRFQALVEGLHARFTPETALLRLPPELTTLEERAEWVTARVGART